MGEADIDQAVRAADKASQMSGWATMTPNERGELLHRLTDILEEHKTALA